MWRQFSYKIKHVLGVYSLFLIMTKAGLLFCLEVQRLASRHQRPFTLGYLTQAFLPNPNHKILSQVLSKRCTNQKILIIFFKASEIVSPAASISALGKALGKDKMCLTFPLHVFNACFYHLAVFALYLGDDCIPSLTLSAILCLTGCIYTRH